MWPLFVDRHPRVQPDQVHVALFEVVHDEGVDGEHASPFLNDVCDVRASVSTRSSDCLLLHNAQLCELIVGVAVAVQVVQVLPVPADLRGDAG